MKLLLIAATLVLAASAAHAQSPAPAPATTASSQQPELAPGVAKTGRRAGDPPVIDHSMDRLVVEPTHSTITLSVPSPPAETTPLADQSRQ
jgi:hypothetical protein